MIARSNPQANPARAARRSKCLLHGIAVVSFMAAHTVHAAPSGALRITETTEATHPFQTLYCARLPIQARLVGTSMEVVVRGESRILAPVIAASGARYQLPGDPDTQFWGKGPLATVIWSGEALPQCAPAGTVIPPFRASGNEPFWAVDYDGWQLTLREPGKPPRAVDAQVLETRPDGQTIGGGDGQKALRLRVDDGICVDSMSGMPRPQRVTLQEEGESRQGCGGDPSRLLQGAVWKVVEMSGKQVATDPSTWISFLTDGKIAGSTGCNRFFGAYGLTGEGLVIDKVASTRMACPPAQLESEQQFTQHLLAVRGFDFDDSGALILNGVAGDLRAVADASAQ